MTIAFLVLALAAFLVLVGVAANLSRVAQALAVLANVRVAEYEEAQKLKSEMEHEAMIRGRYE